MNLGHAKRREALVLDPEAIVGRLVQHAPAAKRRRSADINLGVNSTPDGASPSTIGSTFQIENVPAEESNKQTSSSSLH